MRVALFCMLVLLLVATVLTVNQNYRFKVVNGRLMVATVHTDRFGTSIHYFLDFPLWPQVNP